MRKVSVGLVLGLLGALLWASSAFAFPVFVSAQKCAAGTVTYSLNNEGATLVSGDDSVLSFTGNKGELTWRPEAGYKVVQVCVLFDSGTAFYLPQHFAGFSSLTERDFSQVTFWVLPEGKMPLPVLAAPEPLGCTQIEVTVRDLAGNGLDGLRVEAEQQGENSALSATTNISGTAVIKFSDNQLFINDWNVRVVFDRDEFYTVTPHQKTLKLPTMGCQVSFYLAPNTKTLHLPLLYSSE